MRQGLRVRGGVDHAAPTLDDVLATMPTGPDDRHKRFFIEIKVGPEAVEPLLAALDRAGLPPDQTAVISFNLDTCRRVKQTRPQLPVYYLSGFREQPEGSGDWTPTAAQLVDEARDAGLDGLDLSFKGPIDADFIRHVNQAGMPVLLWTIDDPATADRFVREGAIGITTNRPDVMLQLRSDASGE